MDIDFVVTWVDGSDPAHVSKREWYLTGGSAKTAPERVAVKARRFSDNDEIRYCLRSLRNWAPWARTIWLVTDDQTPRSLDPELAARYGVRLVNHGHLFRGLEGVLPVFNSLAIETMLWRIEGLAEHFVYLNDDVLLTGMTEPTDFFTKAGHPVIRGRWADWSDVHPLSFHGANKVLGATMAGFSQARFFNATHVAHAMRASVLAELYGDHRPAFFRNMAYRFRSREQFWPISLLHHRLIASNEALLCKPRDAVHFSIKFCRTASEQEVAERLNRLRDDAIKITCINYFEAIQAKAPDALRLIAEVTGPRAPFEVG